MKKGFFLLATCVAVLVTGAFTYARHTHVKKSNVNYAYFQLTTDNAADESDASKWMYIPSQNPASADCQTGTAVLCTVYAPQDGAGNIDFTQLANYPTVNLRTDPNASAQVFKP